MASKDEPMKGNEHDGEQKGSEQKSSGQKDNDTPVGKNLLEWTIFGASLLLVGALLSFLGFQAIANDALPPRLEVSLGVPVKAGESVLVPVTVKNQGDTTAAGVEIEVKRRNSDETSHFSLPYVPRDGHRKGWAVFEAPLDKRDLKAAVVGYEES
jgi:uncharacterized protein (TIGR02588 family)